MTILYRLKKIIIKHFSGMRWYTYCLFIAGYVAISWVLLWMSGEREVIQPTNFFYWLIVTASTVGYGDYSPASAAGKLSVVLFVIPFGLGLFAWVVGQFASFVSMHWRRGVQGLKAIDKENHILVIGWNGQRTIQLLKLLLSEQADTARPKAIVLCVRADIENPLPGEIDFVKVRSFTFSDDMQRTSLSKASCIIVDNPQDDITMTTALYCYSQNPAAHTIAYFSDENLGELLKKHCPNVECMPSVAVEMIAKSASDPGSSSLHHQLLAVGEGMTQYSLEYPVDSPAIEFKLLFSRFKEMYDATLIGVSDKETGKMQLNPALTDQVAGGNVLYYISASRIPSVDWDWLGHLSAR